MVLLGEDCAMIVICVEIGGLDWGVSHVLGRIEVIVEIVFTVDDLLEFLGQALPRRERGVVCFCLCGRRGFWLATPNHYVLWES
jgi:hypothetical protein